ncbi:MAG: MraY family glycosyltransferase, partial [Endomicrobiia bacterium]|nr:MraY family glycosyltransferase [Endomicrobiia bacterium]
GIIDDIKHKGLHFSHKFLFQFAAAVFLISYGIRIEFIKPEWFGWVVTLLWVIGISNALNIIDIMDGLSGGTALIAALAFFFIGVPGEEQIYVNFVSIGLAGALLGFLPYNLSRRFKIFMGDAGSLFVGLTLAATALGTRYTQSNNLGVLSPIMILAVPIFDTLFVMVVRYIKRLSPFLGSKDHFALRLRAVGCSDKGILLRACLAGIVLLFAAFVVSKTESATIAGAIYLFFAAAIYLLAVYLYRIKI